MLILEAYPRACRATNWNATARLNCVRGWIPWLALLLGILLSRTSCAACVLPVNPPGPLSELAMVHNIHQACEHLCLRDLYGLC
jgi:hypothetical protein